MIRFLTLLLMSFLFLGGCVTYSDSNNDLKTSHCSNYTDFDSCYGDDLCVPLAGPSFCDNDFCTDDLNFKECVTAVLE
ncbi:MAG: hypothetical protein ACMXYE_03580 [Candidatus Woesearchaeota archaeon]